MDDIEIGQVRQINQPRSTLHELKFIVQKIDAPYLGAPGAWTVVGLLEDGRPIRLEYGMAMETTLL